MKKAVRKKAGKVLSVITTTALLFTCSVFGGGVASNAAGNPFASGTGTKSDPYVIKTVEQLEALSDNFYDGVYFKLGNDIDLSSVDDWTPIYHEEEGSDDYGFEGTLDGSGYKILNMKINESDFSNGDYYGLFDTVAPDGTVKNLGIENSAISLSGTVSSDAYDCYIAGSIAGENDGTISSCYSNATISVTGGSDAGGIVGDNFGTIENCYYEGAITASDITLDNWSTYAAGIAGYCDDKASVKNCYNTATTHFGTANTQNLFAGITNVHVQASGGDDSGDGNEGVETGESFRSTVKLADDDAVGGVTGCYFLSDSTVNTGLQDEYATAKAADALKKQATFSGWDFSAVWHINSACNNGYPYLLPFARTLAFHVTAGSASLKGAQVTVGSESAATDASGKASFLLLPGTFSYGVAATNYKAVSGSETLPDGGKTVEVKLATTGASSSKAPTVPSKPTISSKPSVSSSQKTSGTSTGGNPNTGMPGAAPLGVLAVVLVVAAAAIPAVKRLGR